MQKPINIYGISSTHQGAPCGISQYAKIQMTLLIKMTLRLRRSNEKGSSKIISLCQATFILLVVVVIINNIPYFVSDFSDPNRCWIVQDFAETIAFISAYFSITCAASIVNKYKCIRSDYREDDKWTEELRVKTKEDLFS